MRIAHEGWPIIIAMTLGTALVAAPAYLASPWGAAGFAAAGAVLTLWAVWFFRDPDRTPPPSERDLDLFVSPADGRVIKIDRAQLPPEIRGEHTAHFNRVAIFLNLFNVHVNRTPASGRILRVAYIPGRFFNASLDKASEHNERSAALMIDDRGRRIGFVQIAGLVAWRIVNHLREGQRVGLGDRFGLIRFGSRAEVYFPDGVDIAVKVGDHLIAGESILARAPVAPPPAALHAPASSHTVPA
jgi:phosphatidylserine decarboxylase